MKSKGFILPEATRDYLERAGLAKAEEPSKAPSLCAESLLGAAMGAERWLVLPVTPRTATCG